MEKLFFISGLGADRRLFNNIQLPGYEYVHVDWIEPEPKDTITTYAQKLIETYNITLGSTVIGVSLGGIMTVEISSMVSLHKAIIISSIKSANEFPWYFSLFRNVPVYKVLPYNFLLSMRRVIKPLFGVTAQEEMELVTDMLRNASPRFVKWGMHAVLHWQPKPVIKPVIHLIGTSDVIFSSKQIKDADYIIPDGTHTMVFNRAKDVNPILQSILKNEAA